MKQPLFIFGAGSLARLAFYAAEDSGTFEVVGFVVDDDYVRGDRFQGRPVSRWLEARARIDPRQVALHCAIGYRVMRRRAAVFEQVTSAGFGCVNLVSAQARVSPHAQLGANNFVMAGAVVEAGATLGNNNVLWSNTTVCHDTTIGNHNFIAANATLGGHVTVGDRSFLGFSCVVRERCRVGSDTLVGAQTLMLTDAQDLGVYYGSPARLVRAVDPLLGVTLE